MKRSLGVRGRRLSVEALERREVLDGGPAQVGRVLVGPELPGASVNQFLDNAGLPAQVSQPAPDPTNPPIAAVVNVPTGLYFGPGTDPASNLTPNLLLPVTINGSASFNQPVTSNDFWTNLMFRYTDAQITDPTLNPRDRLFPLSYVNNPIGTDPAQINLTNTPWVRNTADGEPFRQGVSIYNPNQAQVIPINVDGSPSSALAKYNSFQAVTLGIGGMTRADEITPLGVPGTVQPTPIAGEKKLFDPTTSTLNARVNSYSDWGVQLRYGTATDTLTFDLINGSPFTYFQKQGSALAKVWLQAAPPPGQPADSPLIDVWLQSPTQIGVTITVNQAPLTGQDGTASPAAQVVTSYLIVAQSGTWTKVTGSWSDNVQQLFTSDMGNGGIAVAAMPHRVGAVSFESLSSAQKREVAALFAAAALNVPTDTNVSYAYNAATDRVTSTYRTPTASGNAAINMLLPHQKDYLVPNVGGEQLVGTFSFSFGNNLELTYRTLIGVGTVYQGNTFTTALEVGGLLPYLPNTQALTDPARATEIFTFLKTFIASYLQTSGQQVLTDSSNTYQPALMQMGESIQILDFLASPASTLPGASKTEALAYRDYALAELKNYLGTWFDLSDGRVFQNISDYNHFVGYPTAYSAANNYNDLHFHYGYYLNAFATIALFDRDFVASYESVIDFMVREVANYDRGDETSPYLRYFNAYRGHSWANGVAATQESVAESINFASGLYKLGMLLGNNDWLQLGAYLKATETIAAEEYWFNTDNENWTSSYDLYASGPIQGSITQAAIVSAIDLERQVNFGDADTQNIAQAIDAINWIPVSANSLWLGRDQDYLSRNWAQYVSDFNLTPTLPGVYESVVAAYQALLPDQGVGIDSPGPTNALTRLQTRTSPEQDQYSGTNTAVSTNWVRALEGLGQVAFDIVANTSSYAAFTKNVGGSTTITLIAFNPGTTAIASIAFSQGGISIGQPFTNLAPGTMAIQTVGGSTILIEVGTSKPAGGTAFYLRQDVSSKALDLSVTIGASIPADYAGEFNATAILDAYADTYVTVAARSDNSAAPPTTTSCPDGSCLLVLESPPFSGNYVTDGKTIPEIYANPLLQPGLLQNLNAAGNTLVLEVGYDFNGSDGYQFQDRVETYNLTLGQGDNLYYQYSTMADAALAGTSTLNQRIQLVNTIGMQTFPATLALGRVRVRLWEGGFNPTTSAPRDIAVSVDTTEALGRLSQVAIPYTNVQSAPSNPTEVDFVRRLYRDLLHRDPDAAGLAQWVAAIASGVGGAMSHESVAAAFVQSLEYRSLLVEGFYDDYLNRASDAAGRLYWIDVLGRGVSETDVRIGFVTSTEYMRDHPTIATFVTGIYIDLLSRAGDSSGVRHWTDQLMQGLSREAVAHAFMRSSEFLNNTVSSAYARLLRRIGDGGGNDFWLSHLLSGNSRAQLLARFAGSGEYATLV